MKYIKRPILHIILFMTFSIAFFTSGQAVQDEATESSCVTCHTSAVKLIKITREIRKANPPREKSELNKGEG